MAIQDSMERNPLELSNIEHFGQTKFHGGVPRKIGADVHRFSQWNQHVRPIACPPSTQTKGSAGEPLSTLHTPARPLPGPEFVSLNSSHRKHSVIHDLGCPNLTDSSFSLA